MEENRVNFFEAVRGYKLVAETYLEFKELAREQIEKDGLSEDDLNDVIIGLIITKLLVAEGKLEERFFKSAIS